MSVVSSCGLASRGMKAGAVAAGSGFVLDDMAAVAVGVISVVSLIVSWRLSPAGRVPNRWQKLNANGELCCV